MTTDPARLQTTISERDWARTVVETLQAYGWLIYRTWSSMHSPAGFPDIIAVRAGHMLAAELKAEGRKPTAAQERWLTELARVPGVAVRLWRPSDWPNVVEIASGRNAQDEPK